MALTWAVGTAAGVVLGWWGVQLVTFQVVEAQTAPLSQPHVLQALQAAGRSGSQATQEIPAPPAAPTPSPAPTVPTRAGGSLPAPIAPGAGSPPAKIKAAKIVAAGAVSPTTTTTLAAVPPPAPTAPVTVTSEASTTTTAPVTHDNKAPETEKKEPPAPDKPVYRMIAAKGGSVAVRYQGGKVQLLWARPNDGFRVDVVEDGPDLIKVVFRSHDHVSRIKAFWSEGTPRHQVDEYPRDDD
jgi:hypothetical protein